MLLMIDAWCPTDETVLSDLYKVINEVLSKTAW